MKEAIIYQFDTLKESVIAECNVNHRYIFHFTNEEWVHEVLIMEKNGHAFARVYWYHDDNESIYLDWLTVNEEHRKNGIGRELQEIREKIGMISGAEFSYLCVRKETWMHNWYLRRGYVDFKDDEENAALIWMKKSLI